MFYDFVNIANSDSGYDRRDCIFFLAEDGIRYRNVTGVQTCALPIYIDHTTWRTTTIDNLGTTNDEVVHALSPPFLLRPCGPLLGVGLHRCGVGYEVRTATAAALYGVRKSVV